MAIAEKPHKLDRISIRIEPELKKQIELAATLDHRSLTSFIIAGALAMADQTLKKEANNNVKSGVSEEDMKLMDESIARHKNLLLKLAK